MLEQLLHDSRRRILNEFRALRTAFGFRNERAFHMSSGDSPIRRSTISNCVQGLDTFLDRCDRCGEQERRRATIRMEIADGPKRLRRGAHRVAAKRAVYMEIDKTRSEIVSAKIDSVFLRGMCLLADRGYFSLFHDNFQAIANSIGKNEQSVGENHGANVQCLMLNVQHQ